MRIRHDASDCEGFTLVQHSIRSDPLDPPSQPASQQPSSLRRLILVPSVVIYLPPKWTLVVPVYIFKSPACLLA